MDECYWLGSASDSVKDSTSHKFNANAYNNAAISKSESRINFSAYFTADEDHIQTTDTTAGNTNDALTVSFWAKLNEQLGKWAVVLTKTKSYHWNNGWGFVNPSSASDTLRFFINGYSSGAYIDTTLTATEGWKHFVGTYDGVNLRLYKDGVEVSGSPVSDNSGITNSSDPIRIAFDDTKDATMKGYIDEVKIWDVALNSTEIANIESYESNGKNYDGTDRNVTVCDASVAANSWELVGIPIDLRTDPKTVTETFQGMSGSYGADWRVYRRDYSDTNNSSWYTYLASGDSVEFGKAYWLGK